MSYATGEMILFPIPRELLEEIGLSEMDVIQMSVANDKLIIEKAHTCLLYTSDAADEL